MSTGSRLSAVDSQNWLEGTPPRPVSCFTGKRSSSPDPSFRRQPVRRASFGSPPELKARSLSTSRRGSAATQGATSGARPGSSATIVGPGGLNQQFGHGQVPLMGPRWSQLSNSLTALEAEQVRQFLGCDNAIMAPRLRELLERHILPGRDPAEAQAAAAMELQELLYAECPEEMEQMMAVHVKQLSNPFLPNLDSREPTVQKPRFNLLWIQALSDPKLALEVASRWMFAGRRIAEYGDGRIRDMCERLHSMTRTLRLGQCQVPLPRNALNNLRDDDRDFYSAIRMPPWEGQNLQVGLEQNEAKSGDVVKVEAGGMKVRCALIFTECVGRVKMVDQEQRIQMPDSLRVLPEALLPRINSFLQLRGLPRLVQPGCYDAYVSPGTAKTTVHTASTWQQTQNATVVIQRKDGAPFVSGLRIEQDLREISDTLTKWIPLFRAYLGEYADLLGTFMMEAPPHVSYAKVSDSVRTDFWPQRVMPDAATLQALWGERDHDFHMNFALLTSFLAHTSKLTVAMDELDLRWEEVVSGPEAMQEQEYRDLMREVGPLTNVVETLLCEVARVEHERAKVEATFTECARLQIEKNELQGKMAVVDPPLSRIWSRQVLEEARTKIADVLHTNDILLDMKLSVDGKHRMERWSKWLPAILASPDAIRFLADEELSRDAIELTATDDYDKINQRTLQFQATMDAHQVSCPWIAEAIRCPELAFMRDELEAWFRYVYSRIGEDMETRNSKFVPEFDPPTDHPNYFLAARYGDSRSG